MRLFSLSPQTKLEQKIALTAKFFDSEDGDFESYLADWFELRLKIPVSASKAFAKDVVNLYEQTLWAELEQLRHGE